MPAADPPPPRPASPPRLRLFAGVPLDPALAAALAALVPPVEGLRPVPAPNLHVTVHFMGAVDGERVGALAAALAAECARHPAFALALEAVAGGPRPARRARMLWAHLGADERFARLAAGVGAACAPFGVPADERPARPHVTLARAARGRPVPLPDLPPPPPGPVPVERVVLYRSQVGPRGAAYTALAALPLLAR